MFANMINRGANVAWVATEDANAPSRVTGAPTQKGSPRSGFHPASIAVELTDQEEQYYGDQLPSIVRVKVVDAGG
jgi:hypothetical protein